MRVAARQRTALWLRDLAALAASVPALLSGVVPGWVSGVFAMSLVTSVAGLRPLARGRTWAVLALSLVAIVLFGLAFRGRLDLVVAAVSFATLVTSHRLVSQPSEGTNQQVLLAALLLMAGGAALTGELWFGLCLVAFGAAAALHLGLTVVDGPGVEPVEVPLRPIVLPIGLGIALALVGGGAFFLFFPRLSFNLASRRTSPSPLGSTAGMADRVRLGGNGTLKTSARAVLRARLEPDPGKDELERYWVGRRFDVFDGQEWRGSGSPRPPSPVIRLHELRSAAVTQRIELLPAYGSRTLVGLEEPAFFTDGSRSSPGGTEALPMVEVRGEEVRAEAAGASYLYTVMSTAPRRTELDPEARRRALARPHLDPRIEALGRSVTEGESDPERIARRLERYLSRSYGYTLELEDGGDDPLATFLFERKAGHCEHFATALAILLRTQGIPARVTAGFFGGHRVGERYLVRAGDAHSWVEAWVGDAGWITLDATPEDRRGSQAPALWAAVAAGYEQLEELWRRRIVDYGLADQIEFLKGLFRGRGRGPSPGLAPSPDEPPTPLARATGPSRALWALAGVLVLLGWWLGGRRLLERRAARHPATAFLDRLEAILEKAGLTQVRPEPIEVLSRRLTAEHHPLGPAVARATQRYLEARFGGRPLSRSDEAALLRALREGPRPLPPVARVAARAPAPRDDPPRPRE